MIHYFKEHCDCVIATLSVINVNVMCEEKVRVMGIRNNDQFEIAYRKIDALLKI